jgi:glutamyl-tRNA synthetase
MMALLGWNPGTEQEIFSMAQLIDAFSLERVSKAGAKFDPEKAKWFNHQYVIHSDNATLTRLFMPVLKAKGIEKSISEVEKIVGLVKDRAVFVKDLWNQSSYFFEAPTTYDQNTVKKRWKEETPIQMRDLMSILNSISDFSVENAESIVKEWIEKNGLNMGAIMNAFRLCIVGEAKGPHLFDITAIIGKEETLKRIQSGIDKIKNI